MLIFLLVTQVAVGQPAVVPADATLPAWPKPTPPVIPAHAPSVRSKDLEVVQDPDTFGGFVVRVSGKDFAIGQNHPLIGYLDHRGQLRWFEIATAATNSVKVSSQNNAIRVHWEGNDLDGARWQITRRIEPGAAAGAIDVETAVTVDRDRQIAFLPLLVIFPGSATFGTTKGQGIFPGLEYLENEPSSSEADVIGPASKRQVPDNLKITFPLMAIQNDHRFLGLIWRMRPQFSAVFDSPDRLFGSGGHALGLIYPGANGKDRREGSLLPRTTGILSANGSLVLQATLVGGDGETVVPAVEQFVRLHGVPPIPPAPSLTQYVAQAAGGWLNSKIREGNLVRHAIAEGNFRAGPAADAAVWMDWLALKTQDPAIKTRLTNAARKVIDAVPIPEWYISGVGHVRYPFAPLVFGHVRESAARARDLAIEMLGRFEPDGSVRYRPRPDGPDYSRTHFAKEASGFASRAVQDLLEAAAFTGDRGLIEEALKRLEALSKFRNGVPRGAQTWECPLHTPDILASAQMVRAYTLGYELTGDSAYLEQARYWAWTGVPFVYLVNPTGGPVGLYSTIAVFGATHWEAPVWMGLPVQWCGLVYADALYRLARHDPSGPWLKLAEGITVSGIQQSWPASNVDLQGLLPDSFVLREQHRNGPAINPATVQACVSRLFGATAYDSWSFPNARLRVHAPGTIAHPLESKDRVSFSIRPWMHESYFVLINGLQQRPHLRIGGKEVKCSAPHEFLEPAGQLILNLTGGSEIELEHF